MMLFSVWRYLNWKLYYFVDDDNSDDSDYDSSNNDSSYDDSCDDDDDVMHWSCYSEFVATSVEFLFWLCYSTSAGYNNFE